MRRFALRLARPYWRWLVLVLVAMRHVERGTHAELVALDGLYVRLQQVQEPADEARTLES